MQLVSLVRGDPAAYTPGVTREFYVTDSNSGEIWPIETIGDDTVRTDDGFIGGTSFHASSASRRRCPPPRRVACADIGWLPARIMQTEPNGTQLELVWRGKLVSPYPGGDEGSQAPARATGDEGASAAPAVAATAASVSAPEGVSNRAAASVATSDPAATPLATPPVAPPALPAAP